MSAKVSPKRTSSTSPEKVMREVEEDNSDQSDEEDNERLYIVEKILDKKKIKGVWKYFVKWEGYSEKENTWEPFENLDNVIDMVEEFNIKWSQKEENNSPKPQKLNKKASKEDGNWEQKAKSLKKVKTEMNKPSKLLDTVPKVLHKYGHFQYGDQPTKIVCAKQDKQSVLFTVEWKPRADGEVPLPTIMDNLELRKYNKDLLLDFYESRLKFVTSKPPATPSVLSNLIGTGNTPNKDDNNLTKKEDLDRKDYFLK